MLSEHSDLAWAGMTPGNSEESFIMAAGLVLQGLRRFFVLNGQGHFQPDAG